LKGRWLKFSYIGFVSGDAQYHQKSSGA